MQSDTNLVMTPQQQQKSKQSRDVGNSKDPIAATGKQAFSKRHQQEKAQPQQQKCQQQQDLSGKAIKVAGNEARNIAVTVAVNACRDLVTLSITRLKSTGSDLLIAGGQW
jgi:hypothetical protein